MSSQNNMAKESYPYKIIWSGYAPSSPHKVFHHAQPWCHPGNCFIHLCSQTFSTFTRYMSVSHVYSTIGGIEYGGCGEDRKKEIVSHQLGKSTGYGDAHQ